MGWKLAEEVMASSLFGKDLSKKIMLWAVCNFANEKGHGYVFNSMLAQYANVKAEQVRRNKRTFEELGIIEFTYKPGKGRKTHFQLDLMALYRLIQDATAEKMPPLAGGVSQNSGHSQEGETPLAGGFNPTSRGGVIRGKDCKIGAHENISPPNGAENAHDITQNGSNSLTSILSKDFGTGWVKSWCLQIIPKSNTAPDTIVVQSAFAKTSVKSRLQSLSKYEATRVITVLALDGIKHRRLSRAVDNMIEGNPELFGTSQPATPPPWAF